MPRAAPCLLLVLMVLARSVGGFVRPVLRAAAPRSCSRLFSAVSASQGDGYGGDGVTLQCDAAAGGGAAASLIWCHGLGDTAMGWYQTVGAMLPAIQRGAGGGAVRALLPTAPTRPISLNGGMAMPGWSDVYGLSPEDDEDREGFDDGAARLNALIDGEIARGVDARRVLVGGFSQVSVRARARAVEIARARAPPPPPSRMKRRPRPPFSSLSLSLSLGRAPSSRAGRRARAPHRAAPPGRARRRVRRVLLVAPAARRVPRRARGRRGRRARAAVPRRRGPRRRARVGARGAALSGPRGLC